MTLWPEMICFHLFLIFASDRTTKLLPHVWTGFICFTFATNVNIIISLLSRKDRNTKLNTLVVISINKNKQCVVYASRWVRHFLRCFTLLKSLDISSVTLEL